MFSIFISSPLSVKVSWSSFKNFYRKSNYPVFQPSKISRFFVVLGVIEKRATFATGKTGRSLRSDHFYGKTITFFPSPGVWYTEKVRFSQFFLKKIRGQIYKKEKFYFRPRNCDVMLCSPESRPLDSRFEKRSTVNPFKRRIKSTRSAKQLSQYYAYEH